MIVFEEIFDLGLFYIIEKETVASRKCDETMGNNINEGFLKLTLRGDFKGQMEKRADWE